MTEKTALQETQERHSELCAEAHKLGVIVPEELTVDFDTVEAGRAICDSIKKLLPSKPVAEVPKRAHTAKANKAKAEPAAKKAAKQEKESNMSATKKKATKNVAKKSAKKAAGKKRAANGEHKTTKVIALMKRAKGVTREEVLALTGWKAVSMQQLAKSAGVKLKVNKDERPFHYIAA